MSLTLNSSKDIICDKLYLLDTNDVLQDGDIFHEPVAYA